EKQIKPPPATSRKISPLCAAGAAIHAAPPHFSHNSLNMINNQIT
ncbi:hypothetical protein HNW77_12310, partial [Komagataeibacter sp. AV436]|nr:hypothetical protein [Komagataeibacter melomenusus]